MDTGIAMFPTADAIDRVLGFDAWLPDHGRDGDVLDRIGALRARAADAGRRVDVQIMGVPRKPEVLEARERAGATRVTLRAPSVHRGRVERAVERFEDAVAELHGE